MILLLHDLEILRRAADDIFVGAAIPMQARPDGVCIDGAQFVFLLGRGITQDRVLPAPQICSFIGYNPLVEKRHDQAAPNFRMEPGRFGRHEPVLPAHRNELFHRYRSERDGKLM